MATMCLYCGTLSIFTRTMRLRLMTPKEQVEWMGGTSGFVRANGIVAPAGCAKNNTAMKGNVLVESYMDHPELDAAIANLNLEYTVEFVPQNQSRNKDSKDPSLNWRITLKHVSTYRDTLVLTTDYMQGIGHVPGFEDWASNLGYDTDSRKAERIYKACIEIALKLKALIGQESLDKLRELYEGY